MLKKQKTMKYFSVKINIILIIFCIYSVLSASESEEENAEKQYKLQQYEVIKREQKREYKKGVYNDTKKDYVNDWIGKDINYQKHAIKLKKEYRKWAIDKIAKKQKVRFTDYEPLKSITRVEKQILYDYHNTLFKKTKRQNSKNRSKIKKRKGTTLKKHAANEENNKVNLYNNIPANPEVKLIKPNTGGEHLFYILLSAAGVIIISVLTFISIKRFKKKQEA